MNDLVFVFLKEEGYVFETYSSHGDDTYWAHLNGGYLLNAQHLADILNGTTTVKNILDAHWNKIHDGRTAEYFIERESNERDVVEHFSKGRKPGDRYS
jgi:hypothetical protein